LATASESEIDAINQSIALLEEEINSILSTKSDNEDSIVSILNDISSYILIENSKLSDVYKLIM
jgi:hypothetical protein